MTRSLLWPVAIITILSWSSSWTPVEGACPVGHFCYNETITNTSMVLCLPSQYCPGNQSGLICAKGSYCPTTTEQIECPENYYCPPASIVPRPCSPLASCPSGSYRYFHWGCLLLLIILLPLIFGARFFYDQYNARVRNSGASSKNKIDLAGLNQSPDNVRPPISLAPASPVKDYSLQTSPKMAISFSNLGASIQVNGAEKILLEDVSGHFRPGRLIAVMGPSGCGKSSLLNVLTGSVRHKQGTIETRIEGSLESDLRHARNLGMIGVVPQADIMIPSLTPRDILTHSAFTRLPATWSSEQKHERVTDTLRVLNLTQVQHTPVGDEEVRGVSGGEKKRVNIGIELVNSPSFLVLDEPTTGLDATSSRHLIDTLKDISRTNTTVVAVLHQPRREIFRGLDDLFLLANGGRTVYFGPAALTQAYFESIGYICDRNTNPSDFFIDVIAGNAGSPFASRSTDSKEFDPKMNEIRSKDEIQSYLVDTWKKDAGETFRNSNGLNPSSSSSSTRSSSDSKEMVPFKSDVVLPSLPHLMYLYCYRGLLQLVRSLGTVQLELFMHVLAGCIIGMAFVDQNWFIPPIAPDYIQYAPEPMQRSVREDPVRDVLNLMSTYTVMALGLVAAIIGNRCYGQELTNMQRESSAGLSPTAYFWGKAISELPLIVVYSFLYTVSYYLVASPNSTFGDFYGAIMMLEFVMFGLGYCSSLLLSGENALLLAAISALLGGLATGNQSFINSLCWSRWLSEALYLSEIRIDLLVEPVSSFVQLYMNISTGFVLGNYGTDLLALLIYGLVVRLLAYGLVVKKFWPKK